MPIFYHIHPNIIEVTFRFPELPPACKKSVHSINSFLRSVNFRVLRQEWPHPFLTKPTPEFFDQHLTYVNLYQHGKNQAISLICSGDMAD